MIMTFFSLFPIIFISTACCRTTNCMSITLHSNGPKLMRPLLFFFLDKIDASTCSLSHTCRVYIFVWEPSASKNTSPSRAGHRQIVRPIHDANVHNHWAHTLSNPTQACLIKAATCPHHLCRTAGVVSPSLCSTRADTRHVRYLL